MGTNYYIQKDICKHCGVEPERIHIGKSSAGWAFSFNAVNLKTYKEWKNEIYNKDGSLQNEYGEKITAKELVELIDSKKHYSKEQTYLNQLPYLNSQIGEYIDDDGHRFIPREFS